MPLADWAAEFLPEQVREVLELHPDGEEAVTDAPAANDA